MQTEGSAPMKDAEAPRPEHAGAVQRVYDVVKALKGAAPPAVFRYINTTPGKKHLTKKQVDTALRNAMYKGHLTRKNGIYMIATWAQFEPKFKHYQEKMRQSMARKKAGTQKTRSKKKVSKKKTTSKSQTVSGRVNQAMLTKLNTERGVLIDRLAKVDVAIAALKAVS